VQYIFAQNNWHIEEIEYSDKVLLKYFSEIKNLDLIKGQIIEISSGRVAFDVESVKYYFKLENRLYEEN
jgi:hypothetical protein